MRRRLLAVLGTRAEVVKFAPILIRLRERNCDATLVTTGQHSRALMEETLSSLRIGTENVLFASESDLEWEALFKTRFDLGRIIKSAVLVVGDTTSARIGIELAAIAGSPGIHLEAGLRLQSLAEPEEYNRRLMARLATWHLAPFEAQRSTLISEGADPERVAVVGDLSACSLAYRLGFAEREIASIESVAPFVLVTIHRWSNIKKLGAVTEFLRSTAVALPVGWRLVIVTRPDTRLAPMYATLARSGASVLPQLNPNRFLHVLLKCGAVLTDSAGVQQEAVLLGKSVGVLRQGVELYEDADSMIKFDICRALQEVQLQRLLASEGDSPPVYMGDWRVLSSCAVECIERVLDA